MLPTRAPATTLSLRLLAAAVLLAPMLPQGSARAAVPANAPSSKDSLSSPPPIFQDLSFDDAVELARNSKRLLLVDATASWCGPCKNMDRTTWVDPSLVSVIEENAIAIQFDVDEHVDLAVTLRTHALPTIIAMRDGRELDRLVGYKSASQMIAWLDKLSVGVTNLDVLRDRALKTDRRGRFDVKARMEYAGALRYAGRLDEASGEYRWLWEHMLEHDPSQSSVRRSFLAREIRDLIEEHNATRDAFAALRDAAGDRLRRAPDWEILKDWITLNEIIDDPDATIAWVDRVLDDDAGVNTLRQVEFMIKDTLIERGRYDAVGRMIEDPRKAFDDDVRIYVNSGRSLVARVLDADTRASIETSARLRLADRLGVLLAALLASESADASWDLLLEALLVDDSPELRLAIARHAHAAGVLGDRHLALLDPAIESHAEFINELDAKGE